MMDSIRLETGHMRTAHENDVTSLVSEHLYVTVNWIDLSKIRHIQLSVRDGALVEMYLPEIDMKVSGWKSMRGICEWFHGRGEILWIGRIIGEGEE